MKTRDGIYTNINESDYIYEFNNLKFFFSSPYYMKKFINNVKTFASVESEKIKEKFDCNINFDLFYAISYYKKIEKRGFKVEFNNIPISKNVLIVAKCWGDKS